MTSPLSLEFWGGTSNRLRSTSDKRFPHRQEHSEREHIADQYVAQILTTEWCVNNSDAPSYIRLICSTHWFDMFTLKPPSSQSPSAYIMEVVYGPLGVFAKGIEYYSYSTDLN